MDGGRGSGINVFIGCHLEKVKAFDMSFYGLKNEFFAFVFYYFDKLFLDYFS